MKVNPDFIRIEILFNSIETELARRWAFHNVPSVFINRPVMHLRILVKAWWELYHESICARQQRDRLIWERSPSLPAEALDTSALGASLKQIIALIDQETLLKFRSLSKGEESSLTLLLIITKYYLDESVIESAFGTEITPDSPGPSS